jgi:transposase
MSYYGGIDLHSNNSYIGISDGKDKRIFGKRVANELSLILKELAPFKKKIKGIVVESTYNWYWLVDGLMEAKYKVHLANPSANQQYSGLKHTDDKWDSFWLAHMLRLGILKEGYIYPKEMRSVRDLLRKRSMLVRHRTAHLLSLENIIHRNTSIRYNSNDIKQLSEEEIRELCPDEYHFITVKSCKAVVDSLYGEITQIEAVVLKELKLQKSYQALLTVPGIGRILAFTIMLETGDIGRFPSVTNYSSYSRCVSSQRTSNNKKKGVGNKKNGNKYLGWAFVEAANFMKRYSPEAKSWHQRKASKTNNLVATKALANKIARSCYFIIKDQKPFDPNKLFK